MRARGLLRGSHFDGLSPCRTCALSRLLPSHVSALSEARLHEKEWRRGQLRGARSIKPSEGSRSRSEAWPQVSCATCRLGEPRFVLVAIAKRRAAAISDRRFARDLLNHHPPLRRN